MLILCVSIVYYMIDQIPVPKSILEAAKREGVVDENDRMLRGNLFGVKLVEEYGLITDLGKYRKHHQRH